MADDRFRELAVRLRELLEPFAERLVVLHDAPGEYSLGLRRLRDDGYRPWFGGVRAGKRYVSYHLMPVYAHPELLDGASDALRARMQGKACFNFTRTDDVLLAELAELTRAGFEAFSRDGLV